MDRFIERQTHQQAAKQKNLKSSMDRFIAQAMFQCIMR